MKISLLAVFLLLPPAGFLRADVITSWQAGTGDWSNAANWTNGVPGNTTTYQVNITNGTQASPSLVNLNTAASVLVNGGLSIGENNALSINGVSLALQSGSTNLDIMNNGSLVLTGSTTAATLTSAVDLTLRGSGTVTMSGNNLNQITATGTLSVTQLLSGSGSLFGHDLINSSSISGLQGGLTLAATSRIDNTGTIEAAAGGGMLTIQHSTVTNNGFIVADTGSNLNILFATVNSGKVNVNSGATLTLEASTLQGATLTNSAGGNVIVEGASSLTNTSFTNPAQGTVTISTGASLTLTQGTIANNGTLQVAAENSTTGLYLTGGGAVTLSGTGTLALSDSTHNEVGSQTGDTALINGIGHTISGSGNLGLNSTQITNNGTIIGGTQGLTLAPTFSGTGFVNTGLIETTSNGGGLSANLGTYNNTGGTFLANPGSTMFLQSASISGGNITVAKNGILNVDSAQLSGVTLTNSLGGVIGMSGANTIDAASTLNNAAGSTLNMGGPSVLTIDPSAQFINNGTINLKGNSDSLSVLAFTGNGQTAELSGSGEFVLNYGQINLASLVLNGLILDENVSGNGSILAIHPGDSVTNYGTMTATGAGLTVTSLINEGTLAVASGSIWTGQLNNLSDASGLLKGGIYDIQGILQNTDGAKIADNQASLTLDGAGAAFQGDLDSIFDALSELADNHGELALLDGSLLTTLAGFSNDGMLTVGLASSFSAPDFTADNASNTEIDGTLSAADLQFNNGSTLTGTGVIQGDVQNDGTVSPGDAPGKLDVRGNYTQGADGTLDIAIDGTSNNQFDMLAITANASLAGALDITLLNGYTPQVGDVFQILEFGALTGNFSAVSLPTLGGGLVFEEIVEPNGIELKVVAQPTPEPRTWMLFLAGAALLAAARRH